MVRGGTAKKASHMQGSGLQRNRRSVEQVLNHIRPTLGGRAIRERKGNDDHIERLKDHATLPRLRARSIRSEPRRGPAGSRPAPASPCVPLDDCLRSRKRSHHPRLGRTATQTPSTKSSLSATPFYGSSIVVAVSMSG